MDYRVNEVGALIFKPKEDKVNLEDLIEKINKLDERVCILENEIKELKGKGN